MAGARETQGSKTKKKRDWGNSNAFLGKKRTKNGGWGENYYGLKKILPLLWGTVNLLDIKSGVTFAGDTLAHRD